MLKKENLRDAKMIYRTGILHDFPSVERIRYSRFKRAVKNKLMNVYGYYVECQRCGYIVTGEENGVVFISYLAINKNFRGQGYGAKMIEEIVKYFADRKYLVLEADSPLGITDEQELETINRRKNFYYKNGFKQLENIEYCLFGVRFDLLVYELGLRNVMNYEAIDAVRKIYTKFGVNMKYFDVKIVEDKKKRGNK